MFHLFTLPLEFRNNKTSRNHFRWIGFWPLSTQLEKLTSVFFLERKKTNSLDGNLEGWNLDNLKL